MPFFAVVFLVAAFDYALAILIMLLPRLGRPGQSLAQACTRAPMLDIVIALLTAAPWILAAALRGWAGLFGAILGQIAACYLWTWTHELLHPAATSGPRIVSTINRLIGPWTNHLALWLTSLGVPVLWIVRILEITVYPALILLLGFPRYRHGEWVNLSRHKFKGLVGHDLVWCFYCDWMTGVWSLGTEMLRNVESFWCPIRFADAAKNQNCHTDFPDIEDGWVPADGTMAQVAAVLEQKYTQGPRAWFGHTSRLGEAPAADSCTIYDADQVNQQLLLDHSGQPHNHRPMPAATHRAHGHTPICNDRLEVFLQLAGDQIQDISFVATACPICTASASIMTDLLKGKTTADAQRLFGLFRNLMTKPDGEPLPEELADAAALAGVHRFPLRIKCAMLPWHTLRATLIGRR
jgi:SUF system NifU family Fe-S assembly protein